MAITKNRIRKIAAATGVGPHPSKRGNMHIGDVAGLVGKGLAAGVIGTVAMTVSSTVEMKIRKREPSTAPADAAGKVLGVQPRDPAGEKKFATAVHWGYGTGWGGVRGLLAPVFPPALASAAHFATVWGSSLVMLPKLEVAPPLKQWGAPTLAIDALHHSVYAIATGVAFVALDRSSSAPARRSG